MKNETTHYCEHLLKNSSLKLTSKVGSDGNVEIFLSCKEYVSSLIAKSDSNGRFYSYNGKLIFGESLNIYLNATISYEIENYQRFLLKSLSSNIKKSFIEKYNNVNCESFNCWGATACYFNATSAPTFITPKGIKWFLEANCFSSFLAEENSIFVFYNDLDEITHSAIYLGNDLFWHKKGKSFSEICTLEDIKQTYPSKAIKVFSVNKNIIPFPVENYEQVA